MELTLDLKNKGFEIYNVESKDLQDYIDVKRKCYKKYVDEYYGGWVEDIQIKMNTNAFFNMMKESCFIKLLLNGSIVGFFAYDEQDSKIGGISIQIIEIAQNKGIGSFYLNYITSLSNQQNKPIFLKVFISNPAQNLYKRFGFTIYDKTVSHYLMRYDPKVFRSK